MIKINWKAIVYMILTGTLAIGGCAKTDETKKEKLVAWDEQGKSDVYMEGEEGDAATGANAAISGLDDMAVPIKNSAFETEEKTEKPESKTTGSGQGIDSTQSEGTESESERGMAKDGVTGPENGIKEQEITDIDWSEYFDGLNGAAVFWNPSSGQCFIYNKPTAQERHSPCSTFKIISALAAMENGVLDPEDSVRAWSGEKFWNEEWNRDIDFEDAFRASCVWYFREIIDETGKTAIQETLDVLSYGNCDISDWEGRRNGNNGNPALTGFWLESSLEISPKEQAEVMERIFGEGTTYPEETRNALKKAMLLPASETGNSFAIYGKTGTGMRRSVVVDAWFTGFAEGEEGVTCFCVYLGETEGKEVSGTAAREIATRIFLDSHLINHPEGFFPSTDSVPVFP